MAVVKQTALITGATSGIGLELARLFAKDKYNLVLVARKRDELKRVADELATTYKVNVQTAAIDLGEVGAAQSLMAKLERANITVDVLVNNAGFAQVGPFATNDRAKDLGVLQLNIVALTELTKLVVPGMLKRKRGRILNLGSTAAFQPGPFMAVYYASKAYVLSFSQALSEELRGTGVTVTCLCPGPTKTGFQARANSQNIQLFKGPMMDAAAVAAIGYRALLHGERVVVPGFMNSLQAFAARRLSPDWLVLRIVRRLQE